jgi:hypothetical protein
LERNKEEKTVDDIIVELNYDYPQDINKGVTVATLKQLKTAKPGNKENIMTKKYWVSFKLEVREYDEKTERIKSEGILYETGNEMTPKPDVYIRKVLKEQAGKMAETMLVEATH